MQKFFSSEESYTHVEELCTFFKKLIHCFQFYTLIDL